MSECVVRMEMPKDCWRCPCGHSDWIWGDDGKEKMVWFCGIDHDSENERHYQLETEYGSRPSYCPILSALPKNHGKIGDIDSLAEKINAARIRTMQSGGDTNPYWECSDLCLQTPTIVPAERSEI